MKNSDAQEARTESERALQAVIFSIMADNMELFKQFQDNPSFKKWLSDLVFNLSLIHIWHTTCHWIMVDSDDNDCYPGSRMFDIDIDVKFKRKNS